MLRRRLTGRHGLAAVTMPHNTASTSGSAGLYAPAVLDAGVSFDETAGIVNTHSTSERWTAFVVGFLLTTGILLVLF